MNIKDLAKIADASKRKVKDASNSDLILGLPRDLWSNTGDDDGNTMVEEAVGDISKDAESLAWMIINWFYDGMSRPQAPEDEFDVSKYPEYLRAVKRASSLSLDERAKREFGVSEIEETSQCGGVTCFFGPDFDYPDCIGYYNGHLNEFVVMKGDVVVDADSRSSLILGLPREFWESTISRHGESFPDVLDYQSHREPEFVLVDIINENFNDAMGGTWSPEEYHDISGYPDYARALNLSESPSLKKRAEKEFGVTIVETYSCGGIVCFYEDNDDLDFVGYYSGFTDKFNPAESYLTRNHSIKNSTDDDGYESLSALQETLDPIVSSFSFFEESTIDKGYYGWILKYILSKYPNKKERKIIEDAIPDDFDCDYDHVHDSYILTVWVS